MRPMCAREISPHPTKAIRRMKGRELLRVLADDGWIQVRQRGSHRQFKHPAKSGLVTLAFHSPSDDLAPGTVNSILKQAKIKGN
jgi:predicted RNA binding protein YcfA (HicA-like mRNA interferase family)